LTQSPAPQPADPLPGLGLTAILVTGARADETTRPDRLFEDQLASAFVAAASAASPAIAEALTRGAPDPAANEARHNSVALRTRIYDDYLIEAARSGCRQVVLLAAGLDARAYRLPWPDGVRLWELDMPEVFAFKDRVLAGAGATPACERTALGADLREDWPTGLLAAGFDAAQPTAWLVEGLLLYLDEAERDLLLDRIGTLSGAGSRIALDHAPGFFSPPAVTSEDDPTGEAAAARFAALAEAAATAPSLTTPEDWLAAHGWSATLVDAAALLASHNRPVPAQLQAVPPPGAPRRWIATATRA
jgi:methyltransferase (TIGR00027 family)